MINSPEMDPPGEASRRQRNFPSAASQTFFFLILGSGGGGVDCGGQGVICAGLQACSGLLRGCVTGFTGLIRLLSEGHEVELRGLGVATERIFFFLSFFSGQRFIPSLGRLSRNCIVCTERLDSDF